MKKLTAFLLGAYEYRLSSTTAYNDYGLYMAYEWGREWAHRLTFRYFED